MKRAKEILICIALALAISLLFGLGLRRGNQIFYLAPLIFPFLIMGISRPDLVFLSALAILYSKLVFPGFPGELELVHLFLVFVGGVLAVRWLVTKEKLQSDGLLRFAGLGYVVVVFYTMLARGIGFRVFGGGQAGGMRYILIYIGFLVVWFLPNINFKRASLRRALILSAFLSFLPVLAEMVLLASNGRIYQQYYFLRAGFGLGMALTDMFAGEGVRFMSAAILGRGLVYLPFFMFPLRKQHAWKYALLILAGIGIGAFSGFRSVLLSNLIFLFLIGFLLTKGHRKAYLCACFGVVLSGYIFLFLTYDFLPFGIQRSFSFLPLLGRGTEALRDASVTLDFRYEIWTYSVRRIPEFLLLGRGLAFDWNELVAMQQAHWMWGKDAVTGWIANIHNGPLELIIHLGLPGTVFFILFVSRAWKVSISCYRKSNIHEESRRLMLIFIAQLLVTIILFTFTLGNPSSTFLEACINIALVQLLARDLKKDLNIKENDGPES